MKTSELEKYIFENVSKDFNRYEKKSFLHYILEKIYTSTINQILHKDEFIADDALKQIDSIIHEINLGKPIQYICGFAFFYDLIINVDQNVLIPRSETEELVDYIVKFCQLNSINDTLKILDIGTGSGCIALALKSKLTNAEVTGVDIDEKALEVAIANATQLGLDVHFERFDILNYLPDKQSQLYDIIVSNPPYISENEILTMQQSVLDYEPSISLFVTDGDDLQFYKRINAFARQYLKKGGNLFYEINENNGERMVELLEKYNFQAIEMVKDMQGKDRIITGKL